MRVANSVQLFLCNITITCGTGSLGVVGCCVAEQSRVGSSYSCVSVMTVPHTGGPCSFLRELPRLASVRLASGDLVRPCSGDSPPAKLSLSNEVMIFMCMSSKADKPCNSKHVVKVSFVRP